MPAGQKTIDNYRISLRAYENILKTAIIDGTILDVMNSRKQELLTLFREVLKIKDDDFHAEYKWTRQFIKDWGNYQKAPVPGFVQKWQASLATSGATADISATGTRSGQNKKQIRGKRAGTPQLSPASNSWAPPAPNQPVPPALNPSAPPAPNTSAPPAPKPSAPHTPRLKRRKFVSDPDDGTGFSPPPASRFKYRNSVFDSDPDDSTALDRIVVAQQPIEETGQPKSAQADAEHDKSLPLVMGKKQIEERKAKGTRKARGTQPAKVNTRRPATPTGNLYESPCNLCQKKGIPCREERAKGACVDCRTGKVKCRYSGVKGKRVDSSEDEEIVRPPKRSRKKSATGVPGTPTADEMPPAPKLTPAIPTTSAGAHNNALSRLSTALQKLEVHMATTPFYGPAMSHMETMMEEVAGRLEAIIGGIDRVQRVETVQGRILKKLEEICAHLSLPNQLEDAISGGATTCPITSKSDSEGVAGAASVPMASLSPVADADPPTPLDYIDEIPSLPHPGVQSMPATPQNSQDTQVTHETLLPPQQLAAGSLPDMPSDLPAAPLEVPGPSSCQQSVAPTRSRSRVGTENPETHGEKRKAAEDSDAGRRVRARK